MNNFLNVHNGRRILNFLLSIIFMYLNWQSKSWKYEEKPAENYDQIMRVTRMSNGGRGVYVRSDYKVLWNKTFEQGTLACILKGLGSGKAVKSHLSLCGLRKGGPNKFIGFAEYKDHDGIVNNIFLFFRYYSWLLVNTCINSISEIHFSIPNIRWQFIIFPL